MFSIEKKQIWGYYWVRLIYPDEIPFNPYPLRNPYLIFIGKITHRTELLIINFPSGNAIRNKSYYN